MAGAVEAVQPQAFEHMQGWCQRLGEVRAHKRCTRTHMLSHTCF